MVYGRYNELVNGGYKPTFNWGAPSCMNGENVYIYPYGSKHLLRMYLTPQIIPQSHFLSEGIWIYRVYYILCIDNHKI